MVLVAENENPEHKNAMASLVNIELLSEPCVKYACSAATPQFGWMPAALTTFAIVAISVLT